MTEIVQDIYVDSESLGSYNDFNIYLPYPVVVAEDEKAYIRIKDFQQLNSCYNISNDLQNNNLQIIKTSRTFARTVSGTPVSYITDTNLFQTAGANIHKPILNVVHDGVAHTETITPNAGDYTIRLYDDTITTTNNNVIPANAKLNNIFTVGIGNATMTFNSTDYIIYYNKTTPTSGRFVYDLNYTIANVVGTAPANPVFMTLKIWSSTDGITWVENLLNGGNPSIGYSVGEWGYTTTRTNTFTVSSSDTYSYHKVSFHPTGFTSPADMKTKIIFKRINFTRYSAFNETVADSNTTYSHTIEDGAYSLTNINSYLNYLLKSNVSTNLSFSTSYPTQPFLTAQNKQILSWNSTEPIYYYTPEDKTDELFKVEIIFNNRLKQMLGWGSSSVIIFNDAIEAPNYLNLINFKKIILTSSLKLTTKPYTFLNKNYVKASGIGDIIMWINKDAPAFQYINWTNPTDAKIEIDDKLITKINFKITNEYLQVLNDIPSCNFHLQIITTK
jgi:hypothetical protein